MKMPKIKQPIKKTGRARKEVQVSKLIQMLSETKSLVLTNYMGLTHKQMETLKKELRAVNSSFNVTKNSLFKIALEKSEFKNKIQNLDQVLENPTAALFIKGDPMESLKKLAKAMKSFGLPKVKVGIIDGNALDETSIIKLSSLPSKEVLIAQLAGMLNSPIARFTFVLNANLQKLVVVLNEVAKKKPAEAAPAPVDQPAPSEPSVPAPTEEQAPAQESPAPAEEIQTPVEEAAPRQVEVKLEESQTEETRGGEN